MTAYLDLAGFKLASEMADEAVDEVESRYPGFIVEQLDLASDWIDSRLRKRYEVPFSTSSPPRAVKRWLAAIVTPLAMRKRGVEATDEQYVDLVDEAKAAKAEILEAANAADGLYDLPLRSDTTSSGISKGAPLGYAEASPYVGNDRQFAAAVDEDATGMGTGDAIL